MPVIKYCVKQYTVTRSGDLQNRGLGFHLPSDCKRITGVSAVSAGSVTAQSIVGELGLRVDNGNRQLGRFAINDSKIRGRMFQLYDAISIETVPGELAEIWFRDFSTAGLTYPYKIRLYIRYEQE